LLRDCRGQREVRSRPGRAVSARTVSRRVAFRPGASGWSLIGLNTGSRAWPPCSHGDAYPETPLVSLLERRPQIDAADVALRGGLRGRLVKWCLSSLGATVAPITRRLTGPSRWAANSMNGCATLVSAPDRDDVYRFRHRMALNGARSLLRSPGSLLARQPAQASSAPFVYLGGTPRPTSTPVPTSYYLPTITPNPRATPIEDFASPTPFVFRGGPAPRCRMAVLGGRSPTTFGQGEALPYRRRDSQRMQETHRLANQLVCILRHRMRSRRRHALHHPEDESGWRRLAIQRQANASGWT
jgi:hypothetical protein